MWETPLYTAAQGRLERGGGGGGGRGRGRGWVKEGEEVGGRGVGEEVGEEVIDL